MKILTNDNDWKQGKWAKFGKKFEKTIKSKDLFYELGIETQTKDPKSIFLP